jgi:N-acetyl-alpha-D-glucosaminyl L-malate synthase BshA
MRIGIMCLASMGGSARVAVQLAAQLAQRGHAVHLFARHAPFGDLGYVPGLTLHTVLPNPEADLNPGQLDAEWPIWESRAFLAGLVDIVAEHGLEVLHFHYGVPFAFLAAEARRALGRAAPAIVGTLHGTDVTHFGRDPVIGPRLAHALRGADALTSVSFSHARLAVEVLRLPAWPRVIPNCIDLSLFRPARSLPSHLPEDRKAIIAHVSNFRPVKESAAAAGIFLELRREIQAELWLIGDGPDMGAARSLLQASDFNGDVHYWGAQHLVAPALVQADLLLVTSRYESFCLAALEAMACGVPVVAPHVGGLPEVVRDGSSGLLFPPGDYAAAARMAIILLTDPARRAAMRQAAVRHAARFGYAQVVPQYEDLYRGLLARGSRRPAVFPAAHWNGRGAV